MSTDRTVRWINTLTALMAVTAVTSIQALGHHSNALRPAGWWMVLVIAVAFGLAERTVFHFEFRREAISASISEVPLVLALVYLPPWQAVAARIIGSLLIIVLQWRSPLHKLLFNAALFTLEIAVAYRIIGFVTGHFGNSTTVMLFGAVLAAAVPTLIDAVLVSAVISLVEGGFKERALYELRLFGWIAPLNSMAAAAMLAPELMSPWLILVSVVPIIALWAVMRLHGTLEQKFRDLDDLHGFVRTVGPSLDLDELVNTTVTEASTRLRARRVGLVVFDETAKGHLAAAGAPLPCMPLAADDIRWSHVFADRAARQLSPEQLREYGLNELAAAGDVLVSPLHDGGTVLGLMVLAERDGAEARFGDADVNRLSTMTDQLGPTLRKAMLHEKIEFEASHDGLTGLPNRKSFERCVDLAVSRRNEQRSILQVEPDFGDPTEFDVVMLIDLDRFKEVNDTLGHHAGDHLLIEFSNRLRAIMQPGDVLSRLAGDEFAILCRRNVETMHSFATALLQEVRAPFAIDGLEVVVMMSVGVAPMVGELNDSASLMRRADIAMYAAKNQHTGYELYRPEIDRRTPSRLSMLGDLRSALDNKDLNVYLQPKVDLATGVVIGMEALARWNHEGRGEVSPEDFVHVAEESGLIKQLTDLVLESSIEQMYRLRQRGHHLGLAVNLSTHDLVDELLADRVLRRLDQYQIDPAMLTLEITESSLLIDAPRSRNTIDRLNRAGIRLAVDDFGVGYSSLAYLRRLPVSELKIDRSFVTNLLLEDQDEVIVKSIIDLGHNLGLQVVAEGVESTDTLDHLRTMGCDIAQGFGICRPVPFDQLLSWLESTSMPVRRRNPLAAHHYADDTPTDGIPMPVRRQQRSA